MNLHIKNVRHKERPKNPLMQRLFWSLSVILLLMGASYGLLINTVVHNIVEKEKLDKGVTTLHRSVDELESHAMSLKSAVTLEKAAALGFTDDPDAIAFVSKQKTGEPISLLR